MSLAANRAKRKPKPTRKFDDDEAPAPRKLKVAATKSRPAHRHDAKKMLRVIARLDTQEEGAENACRIAISKGRKEITNVTFHRESPPNVEELQDEIIEDISESIQDPRHFNGKFCHRLFGVKTNARGKTLDLVGLQTDPAFKFYVSELPSTASTIELAVVYVSKEKTRRVALASSSPAKVNGSGGKPRAAQAEAVVRKAPALAKAAPGDREPGWLFLRVGAQLHIDDKTGEKVYRSRDEGTGIMVDIELPNELIDTQQDFRALIFDAVKAKMQKTPAEFEGMMLELGDNTPLFVYASPSKRNLSPATFSSQYQPRLLNSESLRAVRFGRKAGYFVCVPERHGCTKGNHVLDGGIEEVHVQPKEKGKKEAITKAHSGARLREEIRVFMEKLNARRTARRKKSLFLSVQHVNSWVAAVINSGGKRTIVDGMPEWRDYSLEQPKQVRDPAPGKYRYNRPTARQRRGLPDPINDEGLEFDVPRGSSRRKIESRERYYRRRLKEMHRKRWEMERGAGYDSLGSDSSSSDSDDGSLGSDSSEEFRKPDPRAAKAAKTVAKKKPRRPRRPRQHRRRITDSSDDDSEVERLLQSPSAGIKVELDVGLAIKKEEPAVAKPTEAIDLSWSSSSSSSSSSDDSNAETEPMSDAEGSGFGSGVGAAAAAPRLPSPASSAGFSVSDDDSYWGDSGLDGF